MAQSFQVSLPRGGSDLEFAAEQEEIARRRRLADVLRQQSAQPEGQMVSGRFVAPSWTQRLAGLFNSYQSGQIDRQAADQSRQVAQQRAERTANDIGAVVNAITGGQRAVEGMPDETGNPTVQMEAGRPDLAQALRVAAAGGPEARAFIPTILGMQQKQQAENPFSRINPSDYTTESLQAFAASGNRDYTLLRPRVKLDFQNTGSSIVPLNPYTAEQVGQPIQRDMTPGERARIVWDQFQWQNLSPEQRERLRQGAASNAIAAGNLGVAQSNLFFNTGMAPGAGAGAGRMNLPPNAPMPNFGGGMPPPMPGSGAPQPVPQTAPQGSPQVPPQGAPRPAPQVLPGQPPQSPAQPPAAPGITPKAAAEQAAASAERLANARRTFPEVVARVRNTIETIDRAAAAVSGGTAGAVGTALGFVPGTAARDLQATLDSVKANLAFDELARMRAASPTGGALGSVTERELTLLESALQSLDRSQSPASLRNNLGRVRTHYVNWANAMAQAAQMEAPELPKPPTGRGRNPEVPSSTRPRVVDFNSLP